jgi:hypothetical protein
MTSLHRFASIVVAVAAGLGCVRASAIASPAPDRSWAHYFAVKTVMQRFYADDGARFWAARVRQQQFDREMGHAPTYDIVNCFRGDEYVGAGLAAHDVTPAFADIAWNVITWRDAFRRLGFAPSTWQQPLTAYEQKEVDRAIASPPGVTDDDPIGAAFEQAMVLRLNAYRAAHPTLPKVVSVGGCGAGEATVTIATAPVATQVLFIPTFFYELCKAEKQNADDPSACPRWREAIEGKLQSVAGDYLYRVRWADGTVRSGTLRFDMGDEGKTITLRKP